MKKRFSIALLAIVLCFSSVSIVLADEEDIPNPAGNPNEEKY